jgi:hypothetical protein
MENVKDKTETIYNKIQVHATEKCSKNEGGNIHYNFPRNVCFLGNAMALKGAFTAPFVG